jgi:hypothetical protein
MFGISPEPFFFVLYVLVWALKIFCILSIINIIAAFFWALYRESRPDYTPPHPKGHWTHKNRADSLLYFECHVTIDPVFADRLAMFESLCKQFQFRVAKLIMVKGFAPSDQDSFCTARSKNYDELFDRMWGLHEVLKDYGFVVRRMKIEDTLFDTKALEGFGGSLDNCI